MRQIQNPNLDYLRRKIIHKKMVDASKKITFCSKCGSFNGEIFILNFNKLF